MERLEQHLDMRKGPAPEHGRTFLGRALAEGRQSFNVADGERLKPEVERVLQNFLIDPIVEISGRPSHRFRFELVKVGFALASSRQGTPRDEGNVKICAESIESLHLGSLVIDDIQDGSQVRRSGLALHRMVGIPQALGVGNWMYFYALRQLSRLDLDDERQKAIYETYIKTVELAHYGQIMDLCVKIDELPPAELESLCYECSRYKTGSIVMLAMVLGGMIGGADAGRLKSLEDFAYELGSYLQFLNDLGNFCGSFDVEKTREDLLSKKPSLVWAFVIDHYGLEAYASLQAAVKKLPEAGDLILWKRGRTFVNDAKRWAEERFERASVAFCQETRMSAADLTALLTLKERIENAYV